MSEKLVQPIFSNITFGNVQLAVTPLALVLAVELVVTVRPYLIKAILQYFGFDLWKSFSFEK